MLQTCREGQDERRLCCVSEARFAAPGLERALWTLQSHLLLATCTLLWAVSSPPYISLPHFTPLFRNCSYYFPEGSWGAHETL